MKFDTFLFGFIFLTVILGVSFGEAAIKSPQEPMDVVLNHNPFKPQLPEKIIEEKPQPSQKQKAEPTKSIQKSTSQPAPPTPEAQQIQLPSLIISGLIWDSDRPQAIINNQIIDIGDRIEDMLVIAIRKQEIDVEYQNKIITIDAQKEQMNEPKKKKK